MQYLLRKYGKTLEVTTYEKKINPKKICLRFKKRSDVVGQRRIDSVRRTRKIFVRRVLSAIEENGSPLLLTLTFKGSASDAYFANEALSAFQRRLRIECPEASSVFVPELSPRGRIHFHGLLFGVSSDWGDSYKGRQLLSVGRERLERRFAGYWKQGFVDVRQTDGSPKLAFYLVKYVLGAGNEVLFNAMRLLRFSKNFSHEITIRDSFICKRIIDGLGSRRLVSEWFVDSVFLGRITKSLYVDSSST